MSRRATRSATLPALLATVLLGSCDPLDYWETFEIEPVAPLSRLDIDVDAGAVEVIVADVDAVQVERHVQGWRGGIALESRVDGDTLTLSARCDTVLTCKVDMRVLVPAGVDVSAAVSTGALTLDGLGGVVDASVGRGELVGRSMVAAELALAVADGSLDLRLDEAPSQLTVAVGTGDVRVRLPAGPYRADLDAPGGLTHVSDVQIGELGPRVDVTVAHGDVSLVGR